MKIQDLSKMLIVVSVDEARVADLYDAYSKNGKCGPRVEISVDAFPKRVETGQVKVTATLSKPMDLPDARSEKVYQAIVSLDESTTGLRPGMTAEVRIEVRKTTKSVLHVPVQAVVSNGKKQYCFVVSDKAVAEREVVTGLNYGPSVEVVSGLQEGERVLFSPQDFFKSGP